MEKHTLYMLNPWTEDDEQVYYYCPDCAVVEGFFFYAPKVKKEIDVVSIDFQRPRKAVVDCLGQENQECPVLVLNEDVLPPDYAKKSFSTGKPFIDDPKKICTFLSDLFNTIKPHR